MILSVLLMLAFVGAILFFNRRNKFLNVIAMYFFSVVIIMLVCVLYVSRLSNYSFPLQTDYDLYLRLSKIHIHIDTLVIISNLAIGLFIFSTLYLIKLIKNYSIKFLTATAVLFIGEFIITNSPKFKWKMFLRIYSGAANAKLYSGIVVLLRYFNIGLVFVIAILPFVYLYFYYKHTDIPLKKKNAISYMLCLLVMELYVYAIFIRGPFKQFMFYNLDMIGFPQQSKVFSSYLSTPVISLVIVLFIVFMFLIFKPFDSLVLLRKKDMIKNTRMMNKNMRMILHIYKNAFLGIEKKTQMGKIFAKDGDFKEVEHQLEDIRSSSLQSVKRIERMLDTLRDPIMVYEEVYLSSVIYSALEKMTFDENIKIEKGNINDGISVLADEEHLIEVFVNLFTNAREAIERKNQNGGIIRFSMVDEPDMVMVEFYDNGCGIERKDYKNIFEPFYSTKKTSDCGGVGLDYVARIIKNHKGEISVKSKVNEYTLFQIVLPVYSREQLT